RGGAPPERSRLPILHLAAPDLRGRPHAHRTAASRWCHIGNRGLSFLLLDVLAEIRCRPHNGRSCSATRTGADSRVFVASRHVRYRTRGLTLRGAFGGHDRALRNVRALEGGSVLRTERNPKGAGAGWFAVSHNPKPVPTRQYCQLRTWSRARIRPDS